MVGGVSAGLLELGDEVEWSARHFGVRQRLRVRITQLDRPRHFRDTMIRGAFARFDHDHYFDEVEEGCEVRDRFDFDSPLGFLGLIANRLVLTRYMRAFLRERNEVIRSVAEGEGWEEYCRQ